MRRGAPRRRPAATFFLGLESQRRAAGPYLGGDFGGVAQGMLATRGVVREDEALVRRVGSDAGVALDELVEPVPDLHVVARLRRGREGRERARSQIKHATGGRRRATGNPSWIMTPLGTSCASPSRGCRRARRRRRAGSRPATRFQKQSFRSRPTFPRSGEGTKISIRGPRSQDFCCAPCSPCCPAPGDSGQTRESYKDA